jgi:hypothetical protein
MRAESQIWIFNTLEAPTSFPKDYFKARNNINWTATYRLDSDIVLPYYKLSQNASSKLPQIDWDIIRGKIGNCNRLDQQFVG